MLRNYIVVYELKNKLIDYSKFYENLKNVPAWAHYIENCWLIRTTDTPQGLDDKIRPHMSSEDRLLIIEVTSNYKGWLPHEAWEWIKKAIG